MINEILTIREVSNSDEWAAATPSINYIGPTMTLFTFDELGHDWMFPASRFRPLITNSQEDDLAIFRPILDQVPTGEDA